MKQRLHLLIVRKILSGLVALLAAICPVLYSSNAAPSLSKPSDTKTQSSAPKTAPKADANALKSLELNEQGVRAVQQKDFLKAESLFKQALSTDERNLTAVYNLAGMYLTNKKDPDAILLLEEYCAKHPTDSGLFARLGDSYFSSKQVPRAITSYEKSLELDENAPGVAAKLGTLYSLSNKLPEAEKMYAAAAKLNPKDSQVLSNLSSLLLTNGKPKEAVQAAKSAIQLKPTAEGYVTLGNAYQQLHDNSNALIAFERAKSMGSTEAALDETIARLKNPEKRS